MIRDPGHYDYWPYIDRPKLTWPQGKKIAFWVAPNIENYEFEPPLNPHRRAMPRPLPDVIHYSHRDYGNRAGFWRMLEAMDAFGVRGSVSLNVATLDHHPEVIEECKARDWEFFSHGVYNTRYLYGMNEAQERAYIEDVIESIDKHIGRRVIGSLTPAITHTERSIPLLAEYDFTYVCDLFHDDQPVPVNVPKGKMISVPYSVELNDFTLFNGSACDAEPVPRYPKGLCRPATGGSGRERFRHVHPNPSVPRRAPVPGGCLRRGTGIHHRLQGGMGNDEPRDCGLLLRTSLRHCGRSDC